MNAKRASGTEPATAIGAHSRIDTKVSSPTAAHRCLKSGTSRTDDRRNNTRA